VREQAQPEVEEDPLADDVRQPGVEELEGS
jgi:hypothetical protein